MGYRLFATNGIPSFVSNLSFMSETKDHKNSQPKELVRNEVGEPQIELSCRSPEPRFG